MSIISNLTCHFSSFSQVFITFMSPISAILSCESSNHKAKLTFSSSFYLQDVEKVDIIVQWLKDETFWYDLHIMQLTHIAKLRIL